MAADRGVDHAHALGLTVDVAVGDFDSISDAGLVAAQRSGARVDSYPADKDATDLELAMEAVLATGASVVEVYGGAPSDRIDHFVANITTLASPRWSSLEVTAFFGPSIWAIVHAGHARRLDIEPGLIVTLLALGGPADGVTLRGVRWELTGARLDAGSSLGVSNESTDSTLDVAIDTGTLAIVVPGDRAPERR